MSAKELVQSWFRLDARDRTMVRNTRDRIHERGLDMSGPGRAITPPVAGHLTYGMRRALARNGRGARFG